MTKNNEISNYSPTFRKAMKDVLEYYVNESGIMKVLEQEFKTFIKELKK